MANTITVTRTYADGDQTEWFRRDYTTAAGARRGLIAAVERETRRWGGQNDASWFAAEHVAREWGGVDPITIRIKSYDHRPGGLDFTVA